MSETRRALEAILMVVDEPVPAQVLAQVLELPVSDVGAALVDLAAEYDAEQRGFCLREVAGGWRVYSHPDALPYVERFVNHDVSSRLTKPALETLAVIAYRQPVSRVQVSHIRGVNAEAVIRNLERRALVEVVGRDPGPGNAVLYGTTGEFLEKLGLRSLGDLPNLADFVPEAELVEALEHVLRGTDNAEPAARE